MRCNCESSHCDHVPSKCEGTPDPTLVMAFVGSTCRPCAELMRSTGGACFIKDVPTTQEATPC